MMNKAKKSVRHKVMSLLRRMCGRTGQLQMRFDRHRSYHPSYFDRGGFYTRAKKTEPYVNPLDAADMDFRSPLMIRHALSRRVRQGEYGYAAEPVQRCVCSFLSTRHGIQADGLLFAIPNVKAGLSAAIRACTSAGDTIILMPPVYGMFRQLIELNGRKAVCCDLARDSDGGYRMDYLKIGMACAAGARMLLLCSPHNPVGRVWRRDELEQLAMICGRYGVAVAADETYMDVVLPTRRFTPYSAVVSSSAAGVVSFFSPGKAFNLAGLHTGFGYCPDAELRQRILGEMLAAGAKVEDVLGMTAARAAYSGGHQWLDAMLHYVADGAALFHERMNQRLPDAVVSQTEGGYFAWVDFSAYGISMKALLQRCHREGLRAVGGDVFGTERCCLRINLACPHRRIEEAVGQLERALEGVKERR